MHVLFIDQDNKDRGSFLYDQIVPLPKVGEEVDHFGADCKYTVTRVVLTYLRDAIEAVLYVNAFIGRRIEADI